MTTARNAAWGVADQIASGLSNVALALAAARVATTAEFGVLSTTIIALTALVSISRVGLGNSVTMSARRGTDTVRTTAAHSVGLILCTAPALAAFVAGAAWIAGGAEVAAVAILMGAATPVVLIQDLMRFLASTLGRSALAFVADSVWLVVMAAAVLVTSAGDRRADIVTVTAAWCLGAMVALATLALTLRAPPKLKGLSIWVKAQGRFLLNAMGGTAAVSAANVGRVSLIGASAGPAAVGALTAGHLIMTPLNLIVALIPFAVTPVIAKRGGSSALRPYAVTALCSAALGLLWWGLCAMIPEKVGRAALGHVWEPAIDLLTPMALLSIGVLVHACAISLLLYVGRSRASALVAIAVAVLTLAGTVAVLRMGGQVQQLAWTQTGVVILGAAWSWALAARAEDSQTPSGISEPRATGPSSA